MLKVGKKYTYTNLRPFPADMALSEITITGIRTEGEGLSVSHDFVKTNGNTGSGTMTARQAEKYLEPAV